MTKERISRPFHPGTGRLVFEPNLSWIKHGLWVAGAGFSGVSIYSLTHGRSIIREQYPISAALVAFLCLAIVGRRPRLAAKLVLATVWVELTLTIFNVGGFNDAAMIVYPVLVYAAGLLLGGEWAVISAVVSSIGVTAAGFLGGATMERLALDHGREGFWLFVSTFCCLGSAVLTQAALRSYAEVLSRSERDRLRYLGLFEHLPEGVIGLDSSGLIIETNDAAVRLLGLDRSELLGTTFADIATRFGVNPPIDIAKAKELQQTIELTVGGRDGVPVTLEIAVRAIRVPEAPTLVLLRDMTHRKLIEQHLGHAQRLEAVGQLAGGIAHDFNNLLTAIGGSAEMIILSGDDDSKDSAEVILSAQRRGTNLTRQLLAFARRDMHQSGAIDLARTVSSMSKMVERLMSKQHRLLIAQAKPTPVEADPAQVEQVVLNLVTNACDAMANGGDVSIAVRQLSGHEARRLGSRLGDDRQAVLEVADTGSGIDPELRVRIFEPFFTTKERGKGTGLGLAAVQGIVAQNKGSLSLESEVGAGSTFRIFFALAAPEPTVAASQGKENPNAATGLGRGAS